METEKQERRGKTHHILHGFLQTKILQHKQNPHKFSFPNYKQNQSKMLSSSPHLHHRSFKSHQLNFQGCRCPICQRVSIAANSQIRNDRYHDRQSQNYHPLDHKEAYLDLIDQLIQWEKYTRKLRFALPQTCVFFNGFPQYWISKSKENVGTKVTRSKSKMNMFEIQHFLLEGYLLHHPEVSNKKKEKDAFKEHSRKHCIVAAKYTKNVTQLLTLDQIENLFKSKYKYMRDGLMYLQTLVGAHHSQEIIIKLDLHALQHQEKELYERAKQQAKIFVNQTKITDVQYYPQKVEIQFERSLRKDIKRYLTYISLKIVFISSKHRSTIISQAFFKWACVQGCDFLWDIRIHHEVSNAPYWQNSVMQALQVKLKKTMSMMELQPQQEKEKREELSQKAKEFSQWLESSTQKEWSEMKVIRTRLEKLETQKKALLESQQNGHDIPANKTFRFRNLRKRQSLNQSANPQF